MSETDEPAHHEGKKHYEIGYKKPPPEYKFKKGVSGNFAGRPKKEQNVHRLFLSLVHETMSIIQNGKVCKTSYAKLVFSQFLKSTATNPKPQAVALFLKLLEQSEAVVKSLDDDTNVDNFEWTDAQEMLWKTLDDVFEEEPEEPKKP